MARIVVPIANGHYVSDTLPVSAQECLNLYPSTAQAPALSKEVLFATPGLQLLATSGSLANRGSHTMSDVLYYVNGGKIYRLDIVVAGEEYQLTEIGEIEGDSRVTMADNGTQMLVLVPGGKGYIVTQGPDTVTEIIDLDFTANGAPQQVVFNDGYFVVTTDSKKFIVSALNDGLTWNALDFGTAEADPDIIVAPIVFRNQLFIGGSETLEAFQNIGGADFPYQRTGLFIDTGIIAPFSIVKTEDSFMFLGAGSNEGPAIWALTGNDVVKVSTIAIDSILNKYGREQLKGVFAWAYSQRGAFFAGFTLPDTTLVYDTTAQKWHERKSFIIDEFTLKLTQYRVSTMSSLDGKVVAGDLQDGRVGFLDTRIYSEYENTIVRRVASQPFQKNMKSFTVPYIELTIESGVGDEDTPEPKVTLDRSLDGGKTFKDIRIRKMGKIGEYNKRCIWRRNGRSARFEVFRFTITDPVKVTIIQLTADFL